MRIACYGYADKVETIILVMNAMLAEGIQVGSVIDETHGHNLTVFGIAESRQQIQRADEALIDVPGHNCGMRF